MKARELATMLLRNPEAEVLIASKYGYATHGDYSAGLLLDPISESYAAEIGADTNSLLLCAYDKLCTLAEHDALFGTEHQVKTAPMLARMERADAIFGTRYERNYREWEATYGKAYAFLKDSRPISRLEKTRIIVMCFAYGKYERNRVHRSRKPGKRASDGRYGTAYSAYATDAASGNDDRR